jgi:hypothetical protein
MRNPYTYRVIVYIAAAAFFAVLPLFSQSPILQSNFADTSASIATASPTKLPVSSKKQAREPKVPRSKQINIDIVGGILTVDGLATKVQLNYDISHAAHLYFFAPGIGTVILSRANMPNSTLVKDAFSTSEIRFNADGHSFDLSSDVPPETGMPAKLKKLAKLDKLAPPATSDGYIVIDYATTDLDRHPMFGYGNTTAAPYAWPLSKAAPKDTFAHLVAPPPPPANMLPRTKRNAMPAPAVVVAATPETGSTTALTALASIHD